MNSHLNEAEYDYEYALEALEGIWVDKTLFWCPARKELLGTFLYLDLMLSLKINEALAS